MPDDPDPEDLGVIGLDLGGTNLAAAFVGPDGRPLRPPVRKVHSDSGREAVIREMTALVRVVEADQGRALDRLGVGIAAQVDRRTGLVHHAPNLRWRDVPLGPQLEAALGVPVLVLNDARSATIGEWRHGAGRGAEDLLVVSVGTGVGASLVIGGRLAEGADGAIGEVGHTILFAGGRRCHCPGRGCLEAYVGGWAIAERAREAVAAEGAAGTPLVERSGGLDRVGAGTVGVLAREGDPLARQLFDETLGWLGAGIAGLVNAFNPRRVLLCGGVVDGWPETIPAVQSAVRQHCQPPARNATVAAGQLGVDAVLIGAASWARSPGD
ncbi:MAG TPA: ROK family protein [Thermoplasmata archaeon]|nr:ROK family protein [Thermoplasmata archaeon]